MAKWIWIRWVLTKCAEYLCRLNSNSNLDLDLDLNLNSWPINPNRDRPITNSLCFNFSNLAIIGVSNAILRSHTNYIDSYTLRKHTIPIISRWGERKSIVVIAFGRLETDSEIRMGDLLQISPGELKFRFELKKNVPVTMSLTNLGTERVAFKVGIAIIKHAFLFLATFHDSQNSFIR